MKRRDKDALEQLTRSREPKQLYDLTRPIHMHGTRKVPFYWEGMDGKKQIMVCPVCKERKAVVIP